MPRFIVIETALLGITGHFHQHAVGTALAAQTHGFTAKVFGGAQALGPWPDDGIPIRPWFSRPMAAATRADGVTTFADDLERLVASEHLTRNDVLCIDTTSGRHLDGLLRFFQRRGIADAPSFLVLLMFDPTQPVMSETPERPLSAVLAELAALGAWPARCAFFAPSPMLSRAYIALSPVQVHAVPLAVRTGALDRLSSGPARPPLTIGVLGEARPVKGYLLLPDLVQALHEPLGRTGKARFLIQASTAGYERELQPATERLRQFSPDYVRLNEAPLEADAYYRAMAETDIVLLPYVGDYRFMVSGVMTEALSMGKPVLVPANTSMAQLLPPGCGEIFTEPAQLPPLLGRMVEQHERYRQAVAAIADAHRHQHSHEHVLGLMLHAAAPYQSSPLRAESP